MLDIANTLR